MGSVVEGREKNTMPACHRLKRQRKRAGNAVDKSIPTGFRHHGLVWVEDESESWLAAEPLDDSSLESGEVDCVFC